MYENDVLRSSPPSVLINYQSRPPSTLYSNEQMADWDAHQRGQKYRDRRVRRLFDEAYAPEDSKQPAKMYAPNVYSGELVDIPTVRRSKDISRTDEYNLTPMYQQQQAHVVRHVDSTGGTNNGNSSGAGSSNRDLDGVRM